MKEQDFINLKNADLIVFDLDGTLAPSKSHLQIKMANELKKLLDIKMVSVISGGAFPQMQKQLLFDLEKIGNVNFENLFIFPTSGASMYKFKKGFWENIYTELIDTEDRGDIIKAIKESLMETDYKKPEKIYGEIIEDRGSQITFSALGQNAPVEEKSKWDPDKKIRTVIIENLKNKLPNFEIRIGGSTSIDITKKGLDKSYGIYKMQEILEIPINKMVYIGDSFGEGGNDSSVEKTGIYKIDVSDTIGPEETENIIDNLIKNYKQD